MIRGHSRHSYRFPATNANSATLDLNFAGTAALPATVTFSRGTNATFTNSAGNVQLTSGVNDPRFDYDPITLVCKGLLIEEARTNLFTYSSQFDNAAWTPGLLNTTGTPAWINVGIAPDGTTSADALIASTSNGNHYSSQTITRTAGSYTHTVYAKPFGYNFVAIQIRDLAGTFKSAEFNVLTGVVVNSTGALSTAVVSVGNGWYKCSFAFNAGIGSTGGNDAIFVGSIAGNWNSGFSGDGTSGILVWGAQAEAGAFATSYIPTTAAAATRNVDVAVMTGTNFSSWYNQTQGTMFAQYESFNPSTAVTDGVFSISDGTSTNRINLHTGVSGYQAYNFVTTGNVLQFSVVRTPFVAGAFVKFAGAYVNSSFAAYADGTQMGATSTSATMPTVNQLQIGGLENIGYPLNGHIARITYYPTRLPNATLQALTAVVTPPTTNFAVKSAAGTSYSTTRNVLSAAGTSYAVSATVLSANGTSYTPI